MLLVQSPGGDDVNTISAQSMHRGVGPIFGRSFTAEVACRDWLQAETLGRFGRDRLHGRIVSKNKSVSKLPQSIRWREVLCPRARKRRSVWTASSLLALSPGVRDR